MNGKIKIKGQLKLYMQWPVILAVLLILMDICVFRINRRAGAAASGFLAVYLLIVIFLYHHSRAIIMNDADFFCYPVRQVQRSLLKDLSFLMHCWTAKES